MTELRCEKIVKRDTYATDTQGRKRYYHEKCGAPAAEYTLKGLLTEAKAVLCHSHKAMADHEIARQQIAPPPKKRIALEKAGQQRLR